MYTVDWDLETRGIILKNENNLLGMETRPVYASELKNFGFDQYCDFEMDDKAPLLWARRYKYFYQGVQVAELVDCGCLKKPELKILEGSFIGTRLEFTDVDGMLEKNKPLMDELVRDTLSRMYMVYMKYKDSVNGIQVAYSGGKDSIVVLDLAKRILPHNSFVVAFEDTGMEMNETIKTVNKEKEACEKQGIRFEMCEPISDPYEDWIRIGPPSFANRWCCSVAKSVPNTIYNRIKLGGDIANYRFLNILGNRAAESSSRMKSELFTENAKHKNTIDLNGIINWSSAEVHLYIMMNDLYLNDGYKQGFFRIGCRLCPRSSPMAMAIANLVYESETRPWMEAIKDTYRASFKSEEELEIYINQGEWRFRKDSSGTKYSVPYKEFFENDNLVFECRKASSSWRTWMKTIGVMSEKGNDEYIIDHRGKTYPFMVKDIDKGFKVSIAKDFDKDFITYFKNVFRKASSCIGCRTCEANCPYGHLKFVDRVPVIDDGCLHCSSCHKNMKACLVFDSWHKEDDVV